jgi:cation transport ATPase
MKMKAMGHQTLRLRANQTTDHTGKLLRTNEELPKKKEERYGCKMKKTGDKNFFKMLRSVEQLKRPEENKTEETLNLEFNKKKKDAKQKLRAKNKEEKNKEKSGKRLKKKEDRKKKLECKLRKKNHNRDMNKLAKLLLSYKTELLKLQLSIFKKKCLPTTALSTVWMFSSNLMVTIMAILQPMNSKVISLRMKT